MDENQIESAELVETAEEKTVDLKTYQTIEAQKNHWKKKYEDEIKVKETKTEDNSAAKTNSDDVETVLQLRSDGYSDAEILKLRQYARKMNSPIEEVVKDGFIKSGIEAERQKSKVDADTPPPSNRSVVINNKRWDEMNDSERKTNYQAVVEQISKRGKDSNV